MENIAYRLKILAENEGITITKLETIIGTSRGTFTRSINRKTDINSKWIVKVIDRFPKYSSRWILTGLGDMFESFNTSTSSDGLVIDRIKFIADRENITLYTLEKRINSSKGVLSKAFKNKTEISIKWLNKICDIFPQYNPNWILTGKSDILLSSNERRKIPVYNQKSLVQIDNMHTSYNFTNEYISIPNINADYAIYAFENSMLPIIKPGNIIVLKKLEDIDNIIPGFIYIISFNIENEVITVAKYIKKGSTEETISLESENSFYQPVEIPKSSIKSFARVLCTVNYNN